jgi:hypothetical protein
MKNQLKMFMKYQYKFCQTLISLFFLVETDKIRNTIKEMLEKEQNNRISSSDVVNRLTNIILKVRQNTSRKRFLNYYYA